MSSNRSVEIPIVTTVRLTDLIALDILNVAINGGCGEWAEISELISGEGQRRHFYISARFGQRCRPGKSVTVTINDISTGIQRVLADGYPISPITKSKILRIVAHNSETDVDIDVANCIIRALVEGSTSSKVSADLAREASLLAEFRRMSEYERQIMLAFVRSSPQRH